jgi:hypothetical protein
LSRSGRRRTANDTPDGDSVPTGFSLAAADIFLTV